MERYRWETLEFARENGFVQRVSGRRRYLPEIDSPVAVVRHAAERQTLNARIQGTAADMIKIAMINIHQELETRRLRTRMLLQVQDELVFDLYQAEQEEIMALVDEKMRTAIPLDVPLAVNFGTGRSWLEASLRN